MLGVFCPDYGDEDLGDGVDHQSGRFVDIDLVGASIMTPLVI